MRENYFKSLLFVSLLAVALWVAPVTVLAQETTTITILHTNDIHGRFVNTGGSAMGVDTIAAIYAQMENAILVDAGDTIHGLPFVNIGEGHNAIELMNLAGYSVMTPGNHEFNFGWQRLVELEEMANFPFIAANVYQGGQYMFPPYKIFDIAGVYVGFVGIATPDTPITTHPNNVIGISFTDPVEAARSSVQVLQEAGVDVVVVLAHLGEEWAARIAAEVPGIDLFIDGHSHELIEGGYMLDDMLMVQAGGHGAFLGVVEVTVADGEVTARSASIIDRDYALENFTPVPHITAAIAAMNTELEGAFSEVVGYIPVTIYGDGGEHRENLRSREVPIGNLVADSMRWATNAQLALMNSGGIRYHFHAGDITVGDVIEVLAFPNYIVVVEITPYLLREALENGVSMMPGNGRFPQISGFSFVFNEYAEDNERVISISVNGQELDLTDNTTTFTLAINDFTLEGGDGYTTFTGLNQIGQAGVLSDVFVDYLAVADMSAGRFVEEGRMVNAAASAAQPYIPNIPIPSITPPPIAQTGVQGVTGTVVNCWYLNVRRGGSPQEDAIGHLRVGDVVSIIETNDWNWHHIQTPYITGWVYGGYIELR